jgi:hypothetical protein
MAGKCGCAGTTCSCKIQGGGGISVTGAGTAGNPYVISGGGYFNVQDTASLHLVLLGDGSSSSPFTLSGEVVAALDDLSDVDTSDTTVGKVLARKADGTFFMAPPSVAAVGSVSVGPSIEGDGSGGDPLDVRLAAQSGLQIVAGGLQALPRTVTSEADLDTTYGAAPTGALVADTDGSGAWIKTASGWAAILEDTGNVTSIANVTESSGWDILSFQGRRKNGLVQLRMSIRTTVSRTTSVDSGNIGNVQIGTVVTAEFRPFMESALRLLGGGEDSGFYIIPGGGFFLTSLAGDEYEVPAGYEWSIGGTFIGA